MTKQAPQTAPRPVARAAAGNGQAAPQPQVFATARRTIFVAFPTPDSQPCDSPFTATGTFHPDITVMNGTAVIQTPSGNIIGTLNPNPPPANVWTYVFNDPLPQNVPLFLIITGTTNGALETAVQPFECSGP